MSEIIKRVRVARARVCGFKGVVRVVAGEEGKFNDENDGLLGYDEVVMGDLISPCLEGDLPSIGYFGASL